MSESAEERARVIVDIHCGREDLVRLIARTLRAAEEAAYARGVEDAAKVAESFADDERRASNLDRDPRDKLSGATRSVAALQLRDRIRSILPRKKEAGEVG